MEWGPDRSDRPAILFQYNKDRKDNKRAPSSPIGKLIWKGLIIVDEKSKLPLRDFPNIPMCISSREDGWLFEALMRQDSRITHEDIVDRMPLDSRPDVKSISMRRSRFRWKAGCKSWVSRMASGNINDFLDNLVPQAFQDANCTRGWRDLTDQELEEMKKPSKGKYPERSRRAKDQSTQTHQTLSMVDENAHEQDTHSEERAGQNPVLDFDIADQDEEMEQYSTYSGEAADYKDFRDQAPSKPWEKRALQRALAPTRMGE